MSRSGVGLKPDCVPAFEDLKLGRTKDVKYIIYKFSDDKKNIEVERKGGEPEYKRFVDLLPERDCRYAVYDFVYELPGGEGKRNKLCFITWSPDDAPVRAKMVCASSKDALRRSLNGIASEIQATDYSEIAYESVLEKVSKGQVGGA